MNSKTLIYLVSLFLVSSCGVKGDPVYPQGATVPSLMDDYADIKTDQPINETKNPLGKSIK